MSIFGGIGKVFDGVKDFVEDKVVDPVKDFVEDTVDNTKDLVEDVIDTTKDFVEDTVDQTKDFVEDAVDTIGDNVIDPVKDFVEDAIDVVEDNIVDPIFDTTGFDALLSQFAPPKLVDADGVNIDSATTQFDGDVVVLIHGWRSNYQTFEALYTTLETKYPDKHVLGLDWSELADLPGDVLDFTAQLDLPNFQFLPNNTAKAIAHVAETITDQLQSLFDVTGSELTVIGHSLGSLVAAEVGRLYGAINDPIKQLVALDPAAFAKNYDIDGRGESLLNSILPGSKQTVKDFNTVAQDSLALVVMEEFNPFGGIAGDNDFAKTAHDSFLVNLPDFAGPVEKHGAVIPVFNSALAANYFTLEGDDFGVPTHIDDFYNNFGLPNLLNGLVPFFNRAGHEGIITADIAGNITKYQPSLTFTGNANLDSAEDILPDFTQDELETTADPLAPVKPEQPQPGIEQPLPTEETNPQPSFPTEVLDLTGVDGELAINVTIAREAAFDNLLQFYETDAFGAVNGILPGAAGYEDAVRQTWLATPVLSGENTVIGQQTIALTGGTYYAPALLVNGNPADLVTLDDEVLGSDRIRRNGNVWQFEDASDYDYNDLVVTITAIEGLPV